MHQFYSCLHFALKSRYQLISYFQTAISNLGRNTERQLRREGLLNLIVSESLVWFKHFDFKSKSWTTKTPDDLSVFCFRLLISEGHGRTDVWEGFSDKTFHCLSSHLVCFLHLQTMDSVIFSRILSRLRCASSAYLFAGAIVRAPYPNQCCFA